MAAAGLVDNGAAGVSATEQPTADFVGRRAELAELYAGIADVANGRGRCFLLCGDPGIGKTRLADEVTREAGRRGLLPLWGRCWEGGGAPEFWPWTQVLRGCRDAAATLDQLGPARALVDAESSAASAGDAGGPEQARFRLFDAVATFFRDFTRRQPVAIILDDLHAADTDSLLLLQFLTRELRQMRLLIVGTYRESEARRVPAVADSLARVGRDGTHLPLRGLDEHDVAALITHVLARTQGTSAATSPPSAFVATIHRITEGNPFFVDGIVRVLAAEGSIPTSDVMASWVVVPEQVRDAVRRRVQPLPAATVDVLGLAAVMGREFDARIVEHARRAEGRPESLANVLREATRDGVVALVPGSLHRYSFAHALIRETLYDDLPADRRARAHQAIGRALVETHGGTADASAMEIAHHFYCAVPAGGAREALDAVLAAAVHATRVFAFGEAVRQRERALEVFDALPFEPEASAPHERERCELLLGLGHALNGAGDRNRAKDVFTQASACARALGDAEHLAEAALGYGGDWLGYSEVANFDAPAGVFDDALTTRLTEALQALGDVDHPLRARLLSRLAVEQYFSAALEAREALVAQAIAVARRSADRATLATVLAEAHVAITGPHNVSERLAMAREAVGLAQATGLLMTEAAGRVFAIEDLLVLGETNAYTFEVDAFARFAERHKHPGVVWALGHCRVLSALLSGRLDDAERVAREVLAVGRRAQRPALMAYTLQLVAIRREQGRLADLAETIQLWKVLTDQYAVLASLRTTLAFIYAELGRAEEARAEFEVLAARDFNDVQRNVVWLPAMTELAEVCAQLRDAARAAVLYDLLRPYQRHNATGLYCTNCWGSVARSLGRLAALMGRWPDAERHFDLALERNHALGARTWVAHTQCHYGEMLLARDARGDRERAAALLHAAHVTAETLGMNPLAAKAAGVLQQLETTSAPAGAVVEGHLTAAEPPPANRSDHPVVARAAVFRREGEYWSIEYDGALVRLRHTTGLSYLAMLLRHASREFHALELVSGESRSSLADAGRRDPSISAQGMPADAGAILDPQAKAAYRQRLTDLREELEEAEGLNDVGRAEKVRTEIDHLTSELTGAIGLGGRDRRAGSPAERARVNVTRAIAAAIKRIGSHSPPLRDHFAATIRTGTFCSYRPDARQLIDWEVP